MPEPAVSSLVADASLSQLPRLRPGAHSWRVTIPPARDRSGRIIDITVPLVVRGLTRHEVAGIAARRLGSKLPRGTQITRSL